MKFEALENANEEIKRADHLFYVSLKYTRTVDVIKSIIERLINACSFIIESLAHHLHEKGKLDEIPKFPKLRADAVKNIVTGELADHIDFFLLLRKIDKAEFTRSQEFRRHVTMTCEVEGQTLNIKIDTVKEYFEKVKNFLDVVKNIVDAEEE